YTAVTGIWQTVWLEPVAPVHLETIEITPDLDRGTVSFDSKFPPTEGELIIQIAVFDHERKVITGSTQASTKQKGGIESLPKHKLPIGSVKVWSPDSPFLYDAKVTLRHNGKVVDEVRTYFAMRKIALAKDENGVNRLVLNNKPLFQYGPLDQGWWPDGLYTAPTDEALRYDIEVTKKLGMNMARKHVKVEPARWYYWCDKLGLLVW
ncbi:MAG: hypothetical protein GTO04_05715, partial [Planctomycetales bacterium]|nr:hypothetical protein [Planctomycetales bacterium]